uniref:Hypothetical mobile element protein n=1 Tax=Saccharolobus solfataricus (strain ATCC 35092 / DSM 1617 / JCM 11322 / P2) TaxID=273057 RepID=S6DRM6_SACS2|nr:hypothetical mobile element protein [Saccharolobus solfataricus P2]
MGLLRAQRHGAHISVIPPTLLGIAHIGVRDHLFINKSIINEYKKFSINMKKDSALCANLDR